MCRSEIVCKGGLSYTCQFVFYHLHVMRKLFLLFITASLMLVGCDKDEWHPVEEPPTPVTPSEPIDPSQPSEPTDPVTPPVTAEFAPLHVEGRWLCDDKGNHVNLHGFGQTYSPWFNEQGNGWGWGKNVEKCLAYNQDLISKMISNGWKVNWLRLHMDPHWSNIEGIQTTGENDISAFSMDLFKKYLNEVFVPMVKFANQYKLYVVMRPPGVCPEKIAIGDAYHQYLLDVWRVVVNHPDLKSNPYVMFELANEPINIKTPSGEYNSWSDGAFQNCTEFFQQIVDMIRQQGANNILWVPGLSYQMNYQGFAKYPIKGDNIGYAVHCYPGWYGSDSEADGGSVEQGVVTKGHGYVEFQAGWNTNVMPAAEIAPILVTEMDWAPKKYDCSWGKATTGVAGGVGFGANFKYIVDKTGNVSWMLFTGPEHLAKYKDSAPNGNTFLTDPEACVRPIYRWFKEYADPSWSFQDTLSNKMWYFPGTEVPFSPSIWETGTFVNSCLITGQYGFGGWQFPGGLDLSGYKYLVVKLQKPAESGSWSLRIFDENNYWVGKLYRNNFGKETTIVVPLDKMERSTDDNGTLDGTVLDPKHIYILGFWSPGGTPLYFDKIYLTNKDDYSE